ncbi:MAG: hypothetical protein ACFFC6_17610 [Promethearchaeota archaeon]
MKFSDKNLGILDKYKTVVSLVLILLVILVLSFKILQNIPKARVIHEYAKDPDYYSFTPLADAPLHLLWDLIPIIKPNETTLDPEVLQFINNHNVMRNKLSKVTINAESLWPGFSDDKIWPLHYEWDRKARTASVEAPHEKVTLNDIGMFFFQDDYHGSMHTNLLHFVILLTWSPKLFESASIEDNILVRQATDANEGTNSIEVKVLSLNDKNISFCFDKYNGRLVRIKGPLLDYGAIQVDMDNFVMIDESNDIVFPTLIKIRVPDALFNAGLPFQFERVIQLQFDSNDVQLEYL